ncbi:MAG: glycosyltransferase family 39 protein [Verrucomicrobiota bacterium]
MNPRWSLALLLLFAVPALSWQLGSRGLNEPDEGRYATISYEMYAGGDWMTPRLYDRAHFDKPPLTYWLMASAYRVFGVNEWAARLPAALSALGTLLLTWSLGRRLFGPIEALLAGLVLLTSPMFFVVARLCDCNMLLTFWTTLCFWALVGWFADGRRWQLLLFYAAAGVSFLVKGPVGPLVVLLSILAFRLTQPVGLLWRPFASLGGILLAALIALPWFILACLQRPELWDFFVLRELLGRFATTVHGRVEAPWYYLVIFPVAVLPWLPAALAGLLDARRHWRAAPAVRLLVCWVIVPLVFFTLSRSKIPSYILPILPAVALIAGRQIPSLWSKRVGAWIQAGFTAACVAGLVFGFRAFGREREWSTFFAATDLWWLLLALAAAFFVFRYHGWRKAVACAALLVVGFEFSFDLIRRHDHELGHYTAMRQVATAIREQIQPSDKVVSYHRTPMGLGFYLQRPVINDRSEFPLQVGIDSERIVPHTYGSEEELDALLDSPETVYVIMDKKRPYAFSMPRDHGLQEIYRGYSLLVAVNRR